MAPRGSLFPSADSARLPTKVSTRPSRGRRRRPRGRGQGLVEFAISVPVVLLMILFGVDFGRVFLGWLTLTNAVREAANFAALNPTAWQGPINTTVQAEYFRLITAEAAQINCDLPGTLPDPTFPNGTGIGSPAVVQITCQFSLITPIIGNLLGSPLPVSASASFPIRSGTIEGVPVASGGLPSGSFGPGPTPGPTTLPTATPIPTPSQIPTPIPMCLVPDMVDPAVRTNQAVRRWTDNGFTANNLNFSPAVPPHYFIQSQSLTPDTSVPCSSVMTVTQT